MQSKDNGPDMETHHEDAHRCSRLGHADCGAHLGRQRGAGVAGKLLVRGERLLKLEELALLLPRPGACGEGQGGAAGVL